MPALLSRRSAEEPFRVWVPGCSTGEDAYSVAICVLEYLRDARLEMPVQFFGTDLSDAALQKARPTSHPSACAASFPASTVTTRSRGSSATFACSPGTTLPGIPPFPGWT
jgi:two-component system CheB/CheR fusion protein